MIYEKYLTGRLSRMLAFAVILLFAGPVFAKELTQNPISYDQLPQPVKAQLSQRHCRLPPRRGEPGANYIVTGQFFDTAGPDWAVVCEQEDSSAILVFEAGKNFSVRELQPRKKLHNENRSLGIITKGQLVQPYGEDGIVEFADKKHPPQHDAITDEQSTDDTWGSNHYYYADGKWRLVGNQTD